MNQEKPIKHLAMYLRISREKKGENVETLANHREMLTEFCKENNYTFEEFGEVISGGKTELEDRVQLQRLLDNIERFDGILCMELSRISRNGLISQTVKQYCIDYDKPILTPYQIYDLANNETDRLMFDVGAMISSHEHGTIGKRSKANKKQMAKQGLHITGAVPYGFVRNNVTKKLEIDDEAAKIIRYIFELHGKGYGSFKIRDILNEEGYKASKGGLFTLPTIKRIIRNPHYKGWTVFHDRRRIKKQGKVTYEIVDTVTIKDTHPAIIPPEEWDKANNERIMRAVIAKGIREKPVTKTEVTMLKDLIFCGSCRHKMEIRLDHKCDTTGYNIKRCKYIQPNGKKCPTCGIKVINVEEEVSEDIIEYRKKLEERVKNLKDSTSTQLEKEKKQKMNQLKKQIKDIESQEKDLIDLALAKIFTKEEIAAKKHELVSKREMLTEQHDQLENEETSESIKQEIDTLEDIIKTIDKLPYLPPEEVNEGLKTFIGRVFYKREIPEDILKLSTRNEKRKYYPFSIEIDYLY
jgi:DNA invertase Pin-like site-specific DNA recombinase